ncbi:MAG: tetratricopeptide repeat protein [Acidobacteria bacterium]|nr:tetratricopeptide repeat protein [Acidobacteriota bacterium]
MSKTRGKLIVGCCVAALCAACGGSRSGGNRSAANQSAANQTAQGQSANGQTATANDGGQNAAPPDFAKLDADIMQLEAQLADKPDDNSLREAVAQAYVRRGAANYAQQKPAEALRDYQAALNYDPGNEEAELRITQINQESAGALRTDDGKPATVPAKPGASNSNK